MPFPFPDGRFPDSLGAVVQRTVLSGDFPAREVVHTPDGSWLIGDGVNDPNQPGACARPYLTGYPVSLEVAEPIPASLAAGMRLRLRESSNEPGHGLIPCQCATPRAGWRTQRCTIGWGVCEFGAEAPQRSTKTVSSS